MIILLWAILILIIEFALSALLNTNSLAILGMKPAKTIRLSSICNVLYWVRFYIIGKVSDWSVPLIVASIVGDVLGDWWVASRKTRRKKKPVYKKKFPVSTA